MVNLKKDLVSIVIPVYNAEKYVEETIKTFQNQTYKNWEAIFVDDCSTDNSKEIITKYSKTDKRIKYVCQEQNGGPALARNKGVDLAKGQFFCYMDADDLWQKDKLKKQVEFMKTKQCAFSFTSYEYANEEGVPTGKKVIAKEQYRYKQALKNNIISTITVMFNLKLIDKELIKMPDLKYVEDTATWWKILRKGYVAYGLKDVFSVYRRMKKSQSSNKLRTQKPLWNLYRQVEGLSFIEAVYCLFWKNVHAVLRRL